MDAFTSTSTPPVTIASSCPEAIESRAIPVAMAPEEQAVEQLKFMPRSPCWMAIWLAAAFAIERGTVVGLSRRQPFPIHVT